jgi:DNA invertase Pin-like site-specific DNA recombinase
MGPPERSNESKKGMKAAIYSRVSTLDKGQSTEVQTKSLSSYAERMGWSYEVFEDYISAKNLKRPNLEILLNRLRKHEFDILLVSKVDRLSRSVLDFCNLSAQLVSWNIRLIVLDQGLDTDDSNPMAKMLIQLLIVFAEFEREMIRDRTRRGMANARAKGKQIGAKRNDALTEIFDLVQTYHKHGRTTREISKLLAKNYKLKISHMTIHRRLVESGDIVAGESKLNGGKNHGKIYETTI